MLRTQVGMLLKYAKGVWQEQNVDTHTIDIWTEVLEAVEERDVKQAARERALAGMERPTCGQLHHDALEIRERRLSDERARRAKIEYRQSDEERAANAQKFEDILTELTRKLSSRSMT